MGSNPSLGKKSCTPYSHWWKFEDPVGFQGVSSAPFRCVKTGVSFISERQCVFLSSWRKIELQNTTRPSEYGFVSTPFFPWKTISWRKSRDPVLVFCRSWFKNRIEKIITTFNQNSPKIKQRWRGTMKISINNLTQ